MASSIAQASLQLDEVRERTEPHAERVEGGVFRQDLRHRADQAFHVAGVHGGDERLRGGEVTVRRSRADAQLTGPASHLCAPPIADEDAGRLLSELLDAGVNLIDTSIDYGRSEELIGRYLGPRRGEFFLASKCGCSASAPPGEAMLAPHDYSAANVRAGIEQSLRRLQTDYLDLVQVHLSPPRSEMEASGTLEALEGLRAEGKARTTS